MTAANARALVLVGGRVIDPSSGVDRVSDLLMKGGRVEAVDAPGSLGVLDGAEVVDVSGKIVAPGFIDLHTHLRTPGEEWKEDFSSGSDAAARGGFTTVCAMANTYPPPNSAEVVEQLHDRSKRESSVRVLLHGTITNGRSGDSLAPMHELAGAGVVGFSDDGDPVSSSHLMRQALAYSTDLDRPVINHAEDRDLGGEWDMNEGPAATRLGLRGLPVAAETTMIARDIELCRLTGGRLHVPHVSAALSVELIRRAKVDGLNVTAEVTPHHLALTQDWVYGLHGTVPDALSSVAYETNAKMAPPLREEMDCEALISGLSDGTIDAIATDHAPHAETDKVCTFTEAKNGIIGLETAFALAINRGEIDLPLIIRRLTEGPSAVLGLPELGTLRRGSMADVVIIDPEEEWVVDTSSLGSKSRNTPLLGTPVRGKVVQTFVSGECVWDAKLEAVGVS